MTNVVRLPPKPAERIRAGSDEWKPIVTVDEQMQIAFKALYRRHLANPSHGRLRRAIRDVIKARYGQYEITVKDCSGPFTSPGEIMLGLYVNGVPDQGIVLGKLKDDGTIYGRPANDP